MTFCEVSLGGFPRAYSGEILVRLAMVSARALKNITRVARSLDLSKARLP